MKNNRYDPEAWKAGFDETLDDLDYILDNLDRYCTCVQCMVVMLKTVPHCPKCGAYRTLDDNASVIAGVRYQTHKVKCLSNLQT